MSNDIPIIDFDCTDRMEYVSIKYKVTGLPTFILFDGEKELQRVVGAQEDELRGMIYKNP
jgi:thioredoxin-related protein